MRESQRYEIPAQGMYIGKFEIFHLPMLYIHAFGRGQDPRILRIEPTQLEYTKDDVSRFLTLQSLSERLEFVTLILGLEIQTMSVEPGNQLEIRFTDGTSLIAKPAASYESWNVFMEGPGGGWWSCGIGT